MFYNVCCKSLKAKLDSNTLYNLDKLAGQYCTVEAMDCRRGVIDRRYHTFNNLDCRRSIEEGCI